LDEADRQTYLALVASPVRTFLERWWIKCVQFAVVGKYQRCPLSPERTGRVQPELKTDSSNRSWFRLRLICIRDRKRFQIGWESPIIRDKVELLAESNYEKNQNS
jgi:hypothetical protein